MAVQKDLLTPLGHAGVDLQALAIGGRTFELGVDFQQRRADDAGRLDQLTPGLNATLHKEVQRGRIHPFGKIGEEIVLMDEIHTPDSSRYFYADGYEKRQAKGERQLQLSKEFVREWLIANNFMGKERQTVPAMTDEWIDTISKRYIELYEKVIGQQFIPQPISEPVLYNMITDALKKLE